MVGWSKGLGRKPTFSKKGTMYGRKPQKGLFSFNSRGRFLLKRQGGTVPNVTVVGGLQGKRALEDIEGQEWGVLIHNDLRFLPSLVFLTF